MNRNGKSVNQRPKVVIVTLGCPKNEIDSEKLAAMLTEAGAVLVAEAAEAETIIVNTCGFIEAAKQESIDTILELAGLKAEGRCQRLIVTGCLAERYKKELKAQLPEADEVIGLNPSAVVAAVCGRIPRRRQWHESLSRVRFNAAHWAYLRISEGCNNRCSYCAIPLIRGGLRSRQVKEILAEAHLLATSGARELCLVAQDITAFGLDEKGKPRLHELIEQLTQLPSVRWLRLLYTHPAHFYPELIDTISANEKVCRYIDLPLQHINDRILESMKRRVTREEIETLVNALRERIPGLTIRTTFIVGFPGETRAKFDELLRFVEKYRFERMGAFVYSPEEDTDAAGFERQVGDRTKWNRYKELMALQQGIAFEQARGRVGTEPIVLVDSQPDEEGFCIARSQGEAPDIDPFILVKSAQPPLKVGTFARVKIYEASGYDLLGEAVAPVREDARARR